jgi:hypothetical protein
MRVMVAILAAALALPAAVTQAQEKRVSAQESRILLLLPHLEDIPPVYQYFGWNAQASVETAYGGVARNRSTPSRGQVFLNQTAPLTYWRTGSALDAAWVRSSFAFFKDKAVDITVTAPAPGPFARTATFEVDAAHCMAFELRHISNDVGPPTLDQRQSVSGIYCPPTGTALDGALIQRVYEGIFARRDGRIERVLRGVNKPIPPELLRGGRQQG